MIGFYRAKNKHRVVVLCHYNNILPDFGGVERGQEWRGKEERNCV